MKHIRHQQPVGQGFFHTAELGLGAAEFRYVYDCGSRQVSRVNACVDACFGGDEVRKLDVLFLSHLHEDHVSGLDHLLARVHVDTIFLPLLSPEARLSCIVTAVQEGRDTFDRVDFISDPGKWFRSRGVRNIYFVAGDDTADGGVAPGVPTTPDEPPPNEGRPSLDIDFRRLEKFARDKADPSARRKVGAARAKAMIRRGDRVISHVAPIHLVESGYRVMDWVFICYVFPDERVESRLRRELRHRLSGPPARPAQFRDWVFSLLKDPARRAELTDCMDASGVRHNYMSMSLYSGPTTRFAPEASLYQRDGGIWLLENDRCGWLGTGDSELATGVAWQRFEGHYAQVIPRVHTLAVPHHGAQRNFNPALLRLGAEDFVVASRAGNPYHPAPSVRRQLQAAAHLHHVTQRTRSMFGQTFYRAV